MPTARARSLGSLFFVIALGCSTSACIGSIDDSAGGDPQAPLDYVIPIEGSDIDGGDDGGGDDDTSGRDARTPSDSGRPTERDTGAPGTDAGIDSSIGADTSPRPDTGLAPDTTPRPDTAPVPDTAPIPDTWVPPTDAGPPSTRQIERPLGSSDAPNGYLEYLPPSYSKTGVTSPLLVFWHGLGEDGNGTTDLDKVSVNGPPKLIRTNAWPNSRPFVVLSPQNPSGCPSAGSIKAFITWSIAHYNVDLKRIYLSGLSCGAIGSWNYINAELGTTPIAAAVLVAGTGNSAWDSHKCALGKLAIWGFHGDADGTVAPNGTIYPMTNLVACPAPPRRDAILTVYPGVGHDSWSRTFDGSAGHDVYAWMLANHL